MALVALPKSLPTINPNIDEATACPSFFSKSFGSSSSPAILASASPNTCAIIVYIIIRVVEPASSAAPLRLLK